MALVEMPEQFIATVETIAHLVNEENEYPPARSRKLIHYDYVNKRARIAVLTGLNEGKNYTRRYDQKQEYCIRGGVYPACMRSYLSEEMPAPKFPPTMQDTNETLMIDQVQHKLWVLDESIYERSRLYVNQNGIPRRLVNDVASRNAEQVDNRYTPLMTYDFIQFNPVAPSESVFALDTPWLHSTCSRHTGGWPYFHLFHHYLRV